MDLKDILQDEYFPTTLSNAIPAIGPRSFHRPRKDNLATSIDTPISRRITDKSLLASLHRDTSIKIRQPSPSGSTTASKSSKPSKTTSIISKPKKLHLYPPQEPPKFPEFDVPPHRRKMVEKPELSELTEDFIEDPKENIPDNIEDCRIIKSDLKKLRTYQVDNNQYEEALKTHQLIAIIDSKIFELDQVDTTLADLRHSVTKHQEIEQVVATYLAEWDKTYEEFIETMQSELEKIQEENKQELEEFDESIPKELTVAFRKASPRLLNLRSAEKRLAYSNQIPFALQLKQRADLIERQEAERQYIKQCKIYEARRERLIKAHNDRIRAFLEHIKSMRFVMIQARNKTVGGYLKRLNYIDKDIDEIAQNTDLDVEAICSSSIDNDRAEFVKQEEMANPIPLFQPGTAFAISRKKIKEAEEMEKSKESSHYSRSRHSRSQTQSNLTGNQDNQSQHNGQLDQIFQANADILGAESVKNDEEENINENHNEEEENKNHNEEEENENHNEEEEKENNEEENENDEDNDNENGEEENENEAGGEEENDDENDDESQNSQSQPLASNPRRQINANKTIH